MAMPETPQRILIAGVSGSGKTTLARQIADISGITHTEIDGLFHGPNWTPRTEFVDDVRGLVAAEAWVTEWQYRDVRPLLLSRAEMLIWLDLPTRVVMFRVIRRTLSRRLHRTVLWNDNVEPPLRTIFRDREHIIRWAWRTRSKYRDLHQNLDVEHLVVVRLRSRRAVRDWLATFSTDAAARRRE